MKKQRELKTITLTCQQCGAEITGPHQKNRKWCSPECCKAAYYARPGKRELARAATKRHRQTHPRSREMSSFMAARRRCRSPKSSSFSNYGGRGIEFRFADFKHFLRVLGQRPKGTTLDRFPDVNGHYEPGNVRWATHRQQTANRRPELISGTMEYYRRFISAC